MTLGQKIQTLRKQRSLSQEALADLVDVSRQAVSKWESDQSVPELDRLPKLAALFDVSIDYLVDETREAADGIFTDEFAVDEKRLWLPFCLGLAAIGLLVAGLGWVAAQSPAPILAGLAVQVLAVVFYEAFGVRGQAASANRLYRRRFYGIAIWLLTPVPVCLVTFAAFGLLPRSYPSLLPWAAALAIYALLTPLIRRRIRA